MMPVGGDRSAVIDGKAGVAIVEFPVCEEPIRLYSNVPMSYTTQTRLDVRESQGGLSLDETPLEKPMVKNYDALDGGPARWPGRFDVRNWAMLIALDAFEPVAGLTLARDTPGVEMLEGRRDMALVWDLRVLPGCQRRGLGSALMRRAKALAKSSGCRTLKVETQDVNPAACRFYESQGFALRKVNRGAYRGEPGAEDEVQLLYYAEL